MMNHAVQLILVFCLLLSLIFWIEACGKAHAGFNFETVFVSDYKPIVTIKRITTDDNATCYVFSQDDDYRGMSCK